MATPASVACAGRLGAILDLVSSGMGWEEILADHPEPERDDILACLHSARLLVSGESLRRVA